MSDISRVRGDTYGDVLTIKKINGKPIDVTGYAFKMTLDPERHPASNSNNLYTLSGLVLDGPAGLVEFVPNNVQADQTPGTYYYDVEMTDTQNRKRTILSGKYIYTQDITK